jgi:hypothetical protein
VLVLLPSLEAVSGLQTNVNSAKGLTSVASTKRFLLDCPTLLNFSSCRPFVQCFFFALSCQDMFWVHDVMLVLDLLRAWSITFGTSGSI